MWSTFEPSPYGNVYGADPYTHARQQQHQQQLRLKQQQQQLRLKQQQQQQLWLKQQQQQQQQQLQQQKLLLQQKQAQERQRMQAARRAAAVTIQKWWRRARAARRAAAGVIVARALRRGLAVAAARAVASQLRALALFKRDVQTFISTRGPKLLTGAATDKDALAFADGLEKLLVRLDGLSSRGSDIFRVKRKMLVAEVNAALTQADTRRAELRDAALDVAAGEALCRLLDGTLEREHAAAALQHARAAATVTLQRQWRAVLTARRLRTAALREAKAAAALAACRAEADALRARLAVLAQECGTLPAAAALAQQVQAALKALTA